MAEIWKDIPGYEGKYQVSSMGRVKSLDRILPHKEYGTGHIKERILKQNWAGPKPGYLIVFLHKGHGEQHIFRVHRLVAQAFLPRIEGKDVVNHKDCDRSNNCVENLEWCTGVENTRHAWEHGRCDDIGKKQSKAVVNVDTGERFDSIKDACDKYGVSHRAIYQVANGQNQKCRGYHWQFADEYDRKEPLRSTVDKRITAVEQIDLSTGERIAEYKSLQEAERATGVKRQSITHCCTGRYHTAGGYRWRYI